MSNHGPMTIAGNSNHGDQRDKILQVFYYEKNGYGYFEYKLMKKQCKRSHSSTTCIMKIQSTEHTKERKDVAIDNR